MGRKWEVTTLEVSVKLESTSVGVGVSGQDREVREWDFLCKGIMFGWMRLREGEGQWS